MPRGKTASGTETKVRILRVASKLFALEGYKAASLRSIARLAGVEHPSVLHHFADGKAGIYREIIREIIEQASRAVAVALQSSDRHAALIIAAAMWDFFSEHQEYAALILRSGFDLQTEEGKRYQNVGGDIAQLIRSVVESNTGLVKFADGELEQIVFVIGTWCLTYHGSPVLTKNIWLFQPSRGQPKQIYLNFLQQKFDLSTNKTKRRKK